MSLILTQNLLAHGTDIYDGTLPYIVNPTIFVVILSSEQGEYEADTNVDSEVDSKYYWKHH